MSKWIVDIHGDIEGDYEIIEEYKEPKTGDWIEHEVNLIEFFECDQCHRTEVYATNYCPNCGARMR